MSTLDRRIFVSCGAGALIVVAAKIPAKSLKTWDANSYGARGDGSTPNTRALQSTIDAAAEAGGGTVTLAPGVYRTGALFVKSGVTLMIGRDVTLLGSQSLSDYPIIQTRVAGIEMQWPAGLLNIYRARNARIMGEGTIDGDGKPFWDSYWNLRRDYEPKGLRWAADYDCRRPRLVHVYESDHAEIAGLRLARSGFWTVHVCYSRDVHVSDLVIRNNIGGRGPSTDGVDVDSSERITVERCDIEVNDDALCIKAGRDSDGLRVARPCRSVRIRDCIIRDAHAGITFGSETSGGFEDIEVSGLALMAAVPVGIFFKSSHTRGGTIHNIRVRNIKMQGVKTIVGISLNWNPEYSYAKIPDGIADAPAYWRVLATAVPQDRGIPRIFDVRISDVIANGSEVLFDAVAYAQAPMRDFHFARMNLEAAGAGRISNAEHWRFDRCQFRTNDGSPPVIQNSSDIVGLRVERRRS
jgi:polygalacturonase